jgi:hypothetical protein
MPNSRTKPPNALKHGAFTKTALLRGEDPEEFEDLHSRLCLEWNPVGPTETDAVLSIAKCMWRKRRVQNFLVAHLLSCELDPAHPTYNETDTVLRLVCAIQEPDSFEGYTRMLSRSLSVARFNMLEEKFPRENFGSASEWAQAVRNEMISVWLPALDGPSNAALAFASVGNFPQELFKLELALDERLDAMIDRAVKRLIQTKAMKQMLGHASRTGGDDQAKKIQNGKPGGSAKIINHKDLPDQ